ncbi:tetratricopeptide repeat protein [Stenotrophomonas rhizophila]|uniref:tetratricopeptide repeat protein n=1 Tax=Stenotrophomonas rhizophila TaxID=216778 RepID=UPI001E296081|nr:tetratricopeptide repeat protein [Stenotrophomonas rhizophila]MCC7633216.1 tetratricopeptide repeat protein [Stenotrophomonas rhizophila]MCC7662109.1 tetratricopeptide repeat protein [Stenotrophomonas rhizophila]
MAVARHKRAGVMLAAGLAMALTAFGAAAQSLPALQEFYFDKDAAAAPMVLIQGSDSGLVDQLMKQRERGRKALEATVQLAGVAMAQGRPELGRTLYQEALATAPATTVPGRTVRWNYGWDLFRLGQAEAALAQWNAAVGGMRGNPSWAPPTYALALWTLGRKDEAVRWYAAAVRTEPGLWNDSSRHAQLLPGWRDSERATLVAVQQAWAAQPPAWP